MKFKILDCTLRDGGYYNNWDFDNMISDKYIRSMQHLPIDILEIGYRSMPQKEYLGAFFYTPSFLIEHIASMNTKKKLGIMLNEKSTDTKDVDKLLTGLEGKISVIRVAVNPENLERAITLGHLIREKGYDLTFNMMYMSKYSQDQKFLKKMEILNGLTTYLYLVDSYGGMLPYDVTTMIHNVQRYYQGSIGFHSHNNLELSFANSLAAVEAGCEIIDSTIMGMGRGAGNLKTELLLTFLASNGKVDFDFNILSGLIEDWLHLHKKYQWGINLPYIVSGANSLPQKDVMEWVAQSYYSYNSIIRALQTQKGGDQESLTYFLPDRSFKHIFVIGGGASAVHHTSCIKHLINRLENICIIHASSKNARYYEDIAVDQFFCLIGNEGRRLEEVFKSLINFNGKCILPPSPRKMGTYLPEKIRNNAFELNELTFTNKCQDSQTALAFELALRLKPENVYLVGYDGYNSESITLREQNLFNENDYLMKELSKLTNVCSLLPTNYSVKIESVYALISA